MNYRLREMFYVNNDGSRGLSHTPRRMKDNEIFTLYNPFYYDLSSTQVTINPQWAMAPGIKLLWLAQSIDGIVRLILGVEADTPGHFLDFADRFAVGHNLTERDAADLHLLGHPTLAHIGTGVPARDDDGSLETRLSYVQDIDHYSGVVGGELRFENGAWWINDWSGRYGSHRHRYSGQRHAYFRDMVLLKVRDMFMESAGIEVSILDL